MRSFFLFFVFLTFASQAQNIQEELDSVQQLEEVVVTGQYSKQSVKKSVYEVKVINHEEIKQNAANNLADLLNQNLNIQIVPSAQTGKSFVSLFGLDGKYFKVLMDGVPLVSDEGFGNNVDLTQINLDNVHQIEIVEGSMGVSYGANAVSGIINIITKKTSKNDFEITVTSQEETVGSEYEWWAKGRHIQALGLNKKLGSNLYFGTTVNRNQFAGHFANRKGKNYIQNDGLRGYQWLPKLQWSSNSILSYNKKDLNLFYKFDYFHELLNYYDLVVNRTYNQDFHYYDKTSRDIDYKTIRYVHGLVGNGKIKEKTDFDFSVAYQTQDRLYRDYIYDLYTRKADYQPYKPYQYRHTWQSKIALSNLVSSEIFNFQLGAEWNHESGYGAAESSDLSNSDKNTYSVMYNTDVFLSSEFHVNSDWVLRPGARYSIQSDFENQWAISLSSKLPITNSFTMRNVVETSYRTPVYDELYTYFVDANHNVQGNTKLKPENSISFFNHFNFKMTPGEHINLNMGLKISYLNVKDRIELAIVSTQPILAYKYINIDKFRTVTGTWDSSVKTKNFESNFGFTIMGVSEILKSATNANDDYLYKFQLNAGFNYTIPKWHTSLSFNYKFNGKEYQYEQKFDDEDNEVYVKQYIDGYSWSDMSLKKNFTKTNIEAALGIRNLFDVKTIYSSAIGGASSHSDNATGILIGYGRTYFVKLKYTFTSKNNV